MPESAAIIPSSSSLPSRKSETIDVSKIAKTLGLEELAKNTNTFDLSNSYKIINARSKVIDRIVGILDTVDVKLKSTDINIETGKLINYLIPRAGEGLLEKYDFVNQVKLIEIREKLYDIIFKAADDIGNNITKTLVTQKGSLDTLLSYIIPKANQRELEDESKDEIANAQSTIYKAIRSSATEIANNIIAGTAKDAKFKDTIKYVLGDVVQSKDTANQIKELREFVFLKIKQGLELVAEGDSMRSIVKDLLGISEDTKTLLPEDLPWWARDEDIQELKQKTENKQLETPVKTTLPRTATESYEEYRDRNDEARKMREQIAVVQTTPQKNNILAEQDTAQQSVTGTASIDANSDSDILQQVNKEPAVVSITDRSIRDLANLQVSELEKIVRPITMLEEKVIESFEKLAKKIDDLEINTGEEDSGTDIMSILEGAALGRTTAGGGAGRGGPSPQRASRLNKLKNLKNIKAAARGLKGLGILGSVFSLASGVYEYNEADKIEDEDKKTTEKSRVVGETAGGLVGGGLGMWGGAALGTAIAPGVGTIIGGLIGGFLGGKGGSLGGEKLGDIYADSAKAERAAEKKKEKGAADEDSAPKPVSKKESVDTKDTRPAPATNPPTSTSNLNIDTYNYSYDKEQVTQLRLINDTLIRLAENNNIAVNQYSPEPAEVSAEPSSDNGNVKSNAMLGSNAITDYRSNIRNAYSV